MKTKEKIKKLKVLAMTMIFLLIGIYLFYVFVKYLNENLPASLASLIFAIIFICSGISILYGSAVFIDKNNIFFKEKDDDILYIKYKQYEFEVKRGLDIFLKELMKTKSDLKGDNIPRYIRKRIYNYLSIYHNDLINKKINNSVLGSEILSNFENVKLIEDSEKDIYISYRKLKNKRIPSKLWGILNMFIGIVCIISPIYTIEDYNIDSPSKLIAMFALFWILGVLFFCMGYMFYKRTKEGNLLLKKINNANTKMYIANANSFDKFIEEIADPESGGANFYYKVKVGNNNSQINKWFEISEKAYKEKEVVSGKLYIINYEDEYIEDFIADYDLNRFINKNSKRR